MSLNNVPSLIDSKLYEHFSDRTFDPKSRLNVENLDLNEQILKISDAIELLNSELNDLVSGNYKELIDRTKKINELEFKFENVQKNVLNLLKVLDKLKSILSEPYKEIAQRISLLNRLQTTCDLMRRIIRIFSLTKKLDDKQSTNSINPTDLTNINHKELIRRALCLNEVNQLLEEDELLNQIEVIKDDLNKFKQEQSNLTQISLKLMDIGLTKQDITLLTNSLQIFCLFNNLEQMIRNFLDERERLIVETLKTTFNVKNNKQAKIWIKIENLVEELAITINQVNFLNRVLRKRRDALNQNYLIDTLNEPLDVYKFYQLIFDKLNQYLKNAINDNQTIKQIIELEYPKLFKTFNEINLKLSLNEIEIEKQFKHFLRSYEAVYLNKSLSMLFDLVDKIFTINQYNQYGNESFISNKDIDQLIKEISNQLVILDVDVELGKLISKNICQSINLFLVKCEQMIRVGADATQVVGNVTDSQKLNAKIVHKISYFQHQMIKCLPEKTLENTDSIQMIKVKLNECNNLILNVITPFFDSIKDSTSDILSTMHAERYTINSSDNSCSLYMKELYGFLLRIQSDYLKLLPDHEVLTNHYIQISTNCIELFLRHATMVRQHKMPQIIKSKLSNDCDKLGNYLSYVH